MDLQKAQKQGKDEYTSGLPCYRIMVGGKDKKTTVHLLNA